MTTSREDNQDAFTPLLGQEVKLIIQDLGKPHFVRGVLKKVTTDFLYIEGDYSRQAIPIRSVLKITQLTEHAHESPHSKKGGR